MLKGWYIQESDPGIHAICSLILRRLDNSDSAPLPPIACNLPLALQTSSGKHSPGDKPGAAERKWFINQQNQTFAIVDGGEFLMGSPEAEIDHDSDERQHRRLIDRRFAIASTEVTRRDFLKFRLGLFDPLGIVYEWCHDVYAQYPEPLEHGVLDNGQLTYFSDSSFDEQATNATERRGLRGARLTTLPDTAALLTVPTTCWTLL